MATHVIIIGGGFAGLGCARALARHADLHITLIDKNNYHQFQPMLYQVATSQVAPDDIAFSLRKVFAGMANVDVKLGEVAAVDPAAKSVTTKFGETYQGDFLVLAAGSQPNFFQTPGAAEHAFPLYSLDDAERMRSRILEVFEDADRDPARIEEGALQFVVVGAGPTGVEMAGALADLIRDTMAHEYHDLATNAAKIFVVDHSQVVLGAFSAGAHEYAAKVLRDLGVQLLLGNSVKEIGPGHVLLADGTRIKTRLVIWAGGLKAVALAACAKLAQGRGGRIDVLPDLGVAGFPGVYVIGDVANMPGASGSLLPQLGSVALQAGQWAAKNILADIAGTPRLPFEYEDKGIMAMIHRNAAIAELGSSRHELHGALAHAAWIGVHTYLMTGIRNRLSAFVTWSCEFFSRRRGPQVLDRTNTARINWAEDNDAVQAIVPQSPSTQSPNARPTP